MSGTYLDAPFHRFEDGNDLSQILIEQCADLDAIVIHAPYKNGLAVDKRFFEGKKITGKAVLVHTGWSTHWNTETYYTDHPFLTEDAAQYLKNAGVKLVGIDSHNIDDTRTKKRPVHTILLHADILIVEHLCNLAKLPDEPFKFTALPPKFKGVGTFPVRAIAKINQP